MTLHNIPSIPPHLSYETIDNETIVIDLEKGYYYSLEQIASDIWNALAGSVDLEALTARLASRFEHSSIAEEVRVFVEELQKEGLVTFISGHSKAWDCALATEEWSKPVLNKFTDMEDLLLLDPIHETDESGWPHQPVEKSVPQ